MRAELKPATCLLCHAARCQMDLAGDEAVVRAEADIRAVNSSVQIVRTKRCEVDLDMVLNRYVMPPVSLMLRWEG